MSSIPKYIQISEYILNQIKSNELKTGDQIPTESALCDKFHTSRMTVNKALSRLTSDGFIKRVAGKGSFVTNSLVRKNISHITNSFTSDMEAIGLKAGAKLIDYRIIRGSELSSVILNLLNIKKDDFVHYFTRLRTGNNRIISISYDYVPCKIIPTIPVAELEHSFFKYVKSLGHEIFYAENLEITATLPTEEQKKLLEIDEEALLKVSHTTHIETGEALEYIITYYIGELYTYRMPPRA